MSEEILNRVTNSKLKTFDLEEIYPEGKRVVFDIKDWLFQEIILKEKEFRDFVKNHDWSQYKNSYVALTCSVDAIIPSNRKEVEKHKINRDSMNLIDENLKNTIEKSSVIIESKIKLELILLQTFLYPMIMIMIIMVYYP